VSEDIFEQEIKDAIAQAIKIVQTGVPPASHPEYKIPAFSEVLRHLLEQLPSLKMLKAFNNMLAEIEHNATEDTLFERMVLARLKDFKKEWWLRRSK
jgi:hypothetical protein